MRQSSKTFPHQQTGLFGVSSTVPRGGLSNRLHCGVLCQCGLENLVLQVQSTDAFVPAERVFSAGVGLIGGGDLTANRSLAVDFASEAEAVAGASTVKAVSPSTAKALVTAQITGLADGAPAALDTLNELAAALGDDPNFAATVTTQLAAKASAARLIGAGTGLTGGGDLTADRTLSVNIASQAEAEAGVSNTKVMTPLRVAEAIGALVVADHYESTWQTVTPGATLTLPHALAGVVSTTPMGVECWIKCVSADGTFTVGTVTSVPFGSHGDANSTGVGVRWDDTNVYVDFGVTNPGIFQLLEPDNTRLNATASRWEFKVRATKNG